MNDDLVKRLRVVAHKTTEQNATLAAGLGVSSTTQSREYIECILDEAADRIEELEAKLKTSEEIGLAFEEEAGQLRAKLAKAVEALSRVVRRDDDAFQWAVWTLAEITNDARI